MMLARACLVSAVVAAAWSPAAADPAAPAPAGCVIAAPSWSGPGLLLRTPRGRPFATVTEGDLTLRTAGEVSLEIAALGVRLRTAPRPADVPLHLPAGRILGGVVKTGAGTALLWTPRGDGLRLSLPSDPRVRFATAPSLDVACAEVQLQGFHGARGPAPSRRGRWVSIAAEVQGARVGSIRVPLDEDVPVVERVGRRARVEWYLPDGPLADATIVGWVDAADLPRTPNGGVIGMISGGSEGGLQDSTDVRGCSAEHPLLVATSAGQEAIGVVLPGTRVAVRGRPRRGFATVNLIGPAVMSIRPALRLRPGARWVMAADDAADCR